VKSPQRSILTIVLASVVVYAGAACSGGSDGDKTPPARPSTALATSVASGTPAIDTDAITRVTLANIADVQALVSETNGAIATRDVLFADLNGDGVVEAVVPITSGGTQGNVAVIVVTPDGYGGATTMLSVKADSAGGMAVDVADGKLVTKEGRPEPDDPECCPSMLHVMTYAWDGSKLAAESTQDVPNPAGGGKATVAPGVPPPNASQ